MDKGHDQRNRESETRFKAGSHFTFTFEGDDVFEPRITKHVRPPFSGGVGIKEQGGWKGQGGKGQEREGAKIEFTGQLTS